MVERLWFGLCLALGRLLRSARYTRVRLVREGGACQVRKQRALHAPLLVWLSGPLVRMLDGGVRVLSRRDWEERERRLYRDLYGASIRVEAGTLVLPCLPGTPLATLLEDPAVEEAVRREAVAWAVVALARFHATGLTHADAMAENVLVDLDAGVARWLDFETVHAPGRSLVRRRSDDLRALLASCLVRTDHDKLAQTLRHALDVYDDDEVTSLLAASFASAWQRPLPLHLLQAPLSFPRFREIGRLLRQRLAR